MSEYLRYVIQNIEPLRIANDSKCQSNQTETLHYIPGTTIRGYVINELARTKEFEQIRKTLFSKDIRFLNAYINAAGRELLPSPKGFYEDKTTTEGKKKIENVVTEGKFSEGHKRAALGQYCYFDDNCIHYYSVDTSSDLKIKININIAKKEKKNVFRNEYMTKGHTFTGYIAINQPEIKELIKKVFHKPVIVLGNARSAGFGKCSVLSCEEISGLPYEGYLPKQDLDGSCYMMLLSNTTMRGRNGEICGLDWDSLSDKLGVEIDEAKLICSTSTVDVRGYNRIWKSKIPSMVMYEQGSVFHLFFQGKLTKESMRRICDEGIGVRMNEGFGRVLFLRDYEKISYKLAPAEKEGEAEKGTEKLTSEDEQTLKMIAKAYYRNKLKRAMNHYVVEHPLPSKVSSNSKLGAIESLAIAHRYDSEGGIEAIKDYFSHAMDKEEKNNTQKESSSVAEVKPFVERILGSNLEKLLGMDGKDKDRDCIMGIPKQQLLPKKDEDKLKLALVVSVIQYDNKEEK